VAEVHELPNRVLGGVLIDDLGAPLPEVEVSLLKRLGEWMDTHGESVKGVKPANPRVQFYGPASVRGSRLYLHLVMRPVESIVVRGIPARRVARVTLLGTGETLDYRASFEVHDSGGGLGDDALGELAIRAPEPTNALIDVVAIDFAASLPAGLLERQEAQQHA